MHPPIENLLLHLGSHEVLPLNPQLMEESLRHDPLQFQQHLNLVMLHFRPLCKQAKAHPYARATQVQMLPRRPVRAREESDLCCSLGRVTVHERPVLD
jgi:hypothetical protein